MTPLAEPLRQRRSLLALLATELAPREGRWAGVTRIATGCAITVAISMVFRIPEPTYMAYIVFVVSKDEKAATVTSAVGGLAAVTLAIVVTLALSLVDTAEPALRLPMMALATFAAMFTARTFSLGPISYLAGFVIVLLQSLVDDVPGPEALTRATLWIWVVIFVPVAVTLTVNLLFGQTAALLIDRGLRRLLTQLKQSLASGDYRPRLAEWRSTVASLLIFAREAGRAHRGRVTASVLCLLSDALVILEAFPPELTEDVRTLVAAKVHACLLAIKTTDDTDEPEKVTRQGRSHADAHMELPPSVAAMLDTLARLHEAVVRPDPSPEVAPVKPLRQPFVADAFSNPAYWQFALKTTLAVMVSYAIYTLLDWPGLRTAIVTCFFVALSSLGETIHKLLLRLSGALIGGLIAALCIVYVLPQLTDIGQLCLLIGGISLAAAWVATSSEMLSYAGMQIAFAFFLGVLQGYAPASDLTVLRDRVVGILLGNIVITVVFSSLWPESARAGARAAIAEALRAIAAVIAQQTAAREARSRTVQALVRADHYRALSVFELRMLPRQAAVARNLPNVADIERLAGAVFVVTSESIDSSGSRDYTDRIARWVESLADSISQGSLLPPPPAAWTPAAQGLLQGAPAALARCAVKQLESEVKHVASSRL